jgi:hypothetical protein
MPTGDGEEERESAGVEDVGTPMTMRSLSPSLSSSSSSPVGRKHGRVAKYQATDVN